MSVVAITIPIYKPIPSKYEIASFMQAFEVFKNRTIVIVCPYSLKINNYLNLLKNKTIFDLRIERFNDKYFTGIEGYNRLLLSINFYRRFDSFKFIQIYQLDAWVFNDDSTPKDILITMKVIKMMKSIITKKKKSFN